MWEYYVQSSDGRVRRMPEAELRGKLRRGKFTGLELARRADVTEWTPLGHLPLYAEEVAFEGDPLEHARRKTVNRWFVHFVVWFGICAIASFPGPLVVIAAITLVIHGSKILPHAQALSEAGRLPLLGSFGGRRATATPTAFPSPARGTLPPGAVPPAALPPASAAPMATDPTLAPALGYEPTLGVPSGTPGTTPDWERQQLRASVRGRLFGDDGAVPLEIGRYRLGERLGAGGMGMVFDARDTSLDRQVALKLLRPGHEMDAASERLQREARAMARLSHPNVVTVFDVGTHEGSVFVAMEKVDGVTLRGWLREARPSADIIDVLDQAAAGLAAAHDAGLVHRDFKPENVMVDGSGRARVLDFGLAKPLDAAGAHDLLTQTGTMLGTPRYMAPEQFRGEPADARTDQFALGVVFYEALYGTHPYQPDDDRPLPRAVLAGTHRDPPARLDVPSSARNAILRAIAHDPDARHPTLNAFREALGPRPTTSDGLASLAAASRRLLERRPPQQAAPLLHALDDLERTVSTLDSRAAVLAGQASAEEHTRVKRELSETEAAIEQDDGTGDALLEQQRSALRQRLEGLEAGLEMLEQLRMRRGIAQTQLEQLHLDLVRAEASETADLPDFTGPLQELRFQVDAAREVEALLER